MNVYIDPWSKALLNDNLFNLSEIKEKRKDSLLPWEYLYKFCLKRGIILKTAEKIHQEFYKKKKYLYYSFGQLENFQKLQKRGDIVFGSIYLFEPPIKILKKNIDLYYHLPNLISTFKRVYTTSPIKEINLLYKTTYDFETSLFSYPQSHSSIIENYWDRKDRKYLVMVNSYRYSRFKRYEYYSERIRALKYFFSINSIDLYGEDWEKIYGNIFFNIICILLWTIKRGSFARIKHFINSFSVLSKFKEVRYSDNKYDTLSNYKFAICYESMCIQGFISEKIFDCFCVGTIPIYLGAPDIKKYVPEDTFIDRRAFNNYEDLNSFLSSLSEIDIEKYRINIHNFLNSKKFKKFSKECFAERFYNDILKDLKQIK